MVVHLQPRKQFQLYQAMFLLWLFTAQIKPKLFESKENFFYLQQAYLMFMHVLQCYVVHFTEGTESSWWDL